ncbi:unnamed protein product [Adineta steineri]|uniref:Uncharacterized protein n=1 Tax=Adineta steineri TaxID=433720 RepID=A0A813WB40_9BILA|nr:unnamed protein product [Adineta steineri]CAF3580070.1 unnamed protein product [Adineta steineri]
MSTDREVIDAIRLNYSQVIKTVDKLFEYVHRKAQLEVCKLQVEVKLHGEITEEQINKFNTDIQVINTEIYQID